MHIAPLSTPLRRVRGRDLAIKVRPTSADVLLARTITRNTRPTPEALARILTWGADKKVLLTLAAVGWISSRGRAERWRQAGNHALPVAGPRLVMRPGYISILPTARVDFCVVAG
jgi:hypothetical protein